jgi:hypothetical protein
MTTHPLSALTRDQVEEIASASEKWQAEEAARIDAAALGETIDGRPIVGPGL